MNFKFITDMRCLAESNCSTRFCRPLPNLPAQAPCFLKSDAKVLLLFVTTKFLGTFYLAIPLFMHFPYLLLGELAT